jgi:PEGA domain
MRLPFLAGLAVAFALTGTVAPSASFAAYAQPAQGERGYLDIASDPVAKILIDGADTGKVTPQHKLELPAGHHKLTLVTLDGARQRSIGFNVERGQTTQLSVHLAS